METLEVCWPNAQEGPADRGLPRPAARSRLRTPLSARAPDDTLVRLTLKDADAAAHTGRRHADLSPVQGASNVQRAQDSAASASDPRPGSRGTVVRAPVSHPRFPFPTNRAGGFRQQVTRLSTQAVYAGRPGTHPAQASGARPVRSTRA